MAKSSHVVNRSGVFYWRRRLPALLAKAFGRAQLLISLRSRDPWAGQRIGRVLSVQFDRFVIRMHLQKRVPTEPEQALILKQLYQSVIDGCREERARWYDGDELPPGMCNTGPQLPPDHPAILADIETQAVFMEPSATAESLRDDLAANRYAPVRWLLKSILEGQSIDPDTDEVAFRKFLRLAIQMAARAFDDAVQDLDGTAPIGLEQLLEAVATA